MTIEQLLDLGADLRDISDEDLMKYLAKYFPQTRPERLAMVEELSQQEIDLPPWLKELQANAQADPDVIKL